MPGHGCPGYALSAVPRFRNESGNVGSAEFVYKHVILQDAGRRHGCYDWAFEGIVLGRPILSMGTIDEPNDPWRNVVFPYERWTGQKNFAPKRTKSIDKHRLLVDIIEVLMQAAMKLRPS